MRHGGQTVIRGVVSVGATNFLARLAGYIKHVVITACVGLTAELDAFNMAATVLAVVIYTFGDIFDSLGIPRLVEVDRREGEESFLALTGSIFTFSVLLSATLALVLFAASPFVGGIFAPGFSEEKKILLQKNLLLLLPVGLLYLPYHALGSFLRSRRRFQAFYIGELLIACITLVIVYGFRNTPYILPISFSCAYVVAIAYLVAVSWKHFRFFGSLRQEKSRDIIRMLFVLLPVYLTAQMFGAVDKMFASYLPTGAVSALTYGFLIAAIPLSILMLENIFITPLSEAGDRSAIMHRIVVGIGIVSIPIMTFTVCYSSDIVRVALQRGLFTGVSTAMTAEALRYFALAVPSLFLNPVFGRLLQVLRQVKGTRRYGVVALLANAGLNFVFMELGMGIRGLALATTLSNYLITGILFAILSKKGIRFRGTEILSTYSLTAAISVCAAWVVSLSPVGREGMFGFSALLTGYLLIVFCLLVIAPLAPIREFRDTVYREILGKPERHA